MSEDDVFTKTGDTYLRLIHPVRPDEDFRQAISPLVALAPSVPDELVSAMIVGPSWRERLLGLALAMAKGPAAFTGAMLRSLRDVRGISIVPTCAVLAVLARRGLFDIGQSLAGGFDRAAFDGEVGWAIDKAMCFASSRTSDTKGRGPNYGQSFEDQIQVYEWIMGGQQNGAENPARASRLAIGCHGRGVSDPFR
jgi:hypothetical protein